MRGKNGRISRYYFGNTLGTTSGSTAINAFNYILGSKADGTSNGVPVDVSVSIDQDLKNTILASVGILSLGLGLGVGAGIVISKRKK